MRNGLLVGLLLGVLVCVSVFEVIHRTVEIEGHGVCSQIYDELTRRWNPDFVYTVKLVYKVFAWPVKTISISVSDAQVALTDEHHHTIFERMQ